MDPPSVQAIRSVVPVWSPRPPGGRGGSQGESEAISVLRVTTQPVDPLVAAQPQHIYFATIKITAPPPGSPSVSVPEHEQS